MGHQFQRYTDIFADRRVNADRRRQDLTMPRSLCRRSLERRKNNFNARPWWLLVDYVDNTVRPIHLIPHPDQGDDG